MKRIYFSPPITKYVLRICFWIVTLSGLFGAIFHKLFYLFIIFPILDFWLLAFSALFVISIYIENNQIVFSYDLLGFGKIKRAKNLDEIRTISLRTYKKNGTIRTQIVIVYKARKHLSFPKNDIQIPLRSKYPMENMLIVNMKRQPSIASVQLISELYHRLERNQHELFIQTHEIQHWQMSVFEIGVDQQPESEASYDLIADLD